MTVRRAGAEDGDPFQDQAATGPLASAVERLRRLQEFTAALSDTLGVEQVALETLRHGARLPDVVRGGLALLSAGGRELRFVAMHEDMVAAERLPWCTLDMSADLPLTITVNRGAALWYPTLPDLARRFPGMAEHQQDFGTHAFATVPLVAHGEKVGALMLCFGRAHAFDPTERAFLAAFAEQAAHALRRGRAFEQQQATAELLQRSLLPDTLPELPGLAMAARYEPAAGQGGGDVGGDWFDVLPLDDGSVIVVIGDVMGRGVPAATVMGQVRAALRAYALLDPAPEVVLQRLDKLVATLGLPEQIVTVLVGRVDADRGAVRLACAGHVPPLCAHRGEAAAVVSVPTGPPLGLSVRERRSTTVPLGPGSTLVLCTDGLVETSRRSVQDGLARLAADLDSIDVTSRHPREVVSRLVPEVADTEKENPDDRAMLVITSTAGRTVRTDHIDLPADARAAGNARRWLRAVLARWAAPEWLAEEAALCLSEVVTNAVIHTETAPRSSVVLDSRRLVVSVSDSGRRGRARLIEPEPEEIGGRGLTLVAALSSSWGTERRADGTTVWFEFTLPTDDET